MRRGSERETEEGGHGEDMEVEVGVGVVGFASA